MSEVPDRSGSPAPASNRGGWFSNLPEWMRWAIPVMLVFLVVGVLATIGRYAGGSASPEEQVQSLCLTGVRDDLEARGNTVDEMPLFSDVEQVDETEYRTQGSVAYIEDEETERRTVRCIVRVDENGGLTVASIRFGPS
jgi:hypothetical protein